MLAGMLFWRVFISDSVYGYCLSAWETYYSLAHGKDVFFSGSLIEHRFREIELVLWRFELKQASYAARRIQCEFSFGLKPFGRVWVGSKTLPPGYCLR
jgi:hypothetical protein